MTTTKTKYWKYFESKTYSYQAIKENEQSKLEIQKTRLSPEIRKYK